MRISCREFVSRPVKLPSLVLFRASIFCALWVPISHASSSWDGSIELEQRYFWDTDAQSAPATASLARGQLSAKLEMEFFTDWNNGDDNLVFEPFFRLDERDMERTHGDIRQLVWSHLEQDWEVSVGVGRVFWGVTESQHLVDIINQTDGVESIDGEDKLGQPMLRAQYYHDLGNLDFYLLPYFRTRTFAGPQSRLNGGIVVDNNNELFESDDEQRHLDYALRYSNTLGAWGVGFSLFDGTAREPNLRVAFDPATFTTTPYYPQIKQWAADVQLTTAAWLIKFEAIRRDFTDTRFDDFTAATVGAEYTFTGVWGSVYDLGVLAEYSWDERDQLATSPFQNDLFLGARLALNDISSSEVLFGVVQDLDSSASRSVFIEANTRVAASMTANIELRYFASDTPNDLLFGLRDDSFIQLGLQYFFD